MPGGVQGPARHGLRCADTAGRKLAARGDVATDVV